MRTLLLFSVLFGLMNAAACSTTDDTPTDASTGSDSQIDICDIDAFSGNGNSCPVASNRLCFPLCDAGGCRCTKGSVGPVWKCVTDFSCYPDAAPVFDANDDTTTDTDATTADAGAD
ncbi:hypothetical protein BH09MYX1_BH09MYX1_44260 [soil metagenome]